MNDIVGYVEAVVGVVAALTLVVIALVLTAVTGEAVAAAVLISNFSIVKVDDIDNTNHKTIEKSFHTATQLAQTIKSHVNSTILYTAKWKICNKVTQFIFSDLYFAKSAGPQKKKKKEKRARARVKSCRTIPSNILDT